MYYPPQQQMLKCYQINSEQDINNIQIDMMGIQVFCNFNKGLIYTRQLGNNGLPIILTHALQAQAPPPPTTEELNQKIDILVNKMLEMEAFINEFNSPVIKEQ